MFKERDFVKITDQKDPMFGKVGIVGEFYPLSGRLQVQFPRETIGLYIYQDWQVELTSDWG